MRRTLTLAFPTALVALAVSATSAGAVIVPQRGMAGVRIDMTRAQVEGVLGDPSSVRRGRNDFGRYTELVYRGKRLRIFFQGNAGVTSISTSGRSERTSTGVGVGSTEAQVKAGLRGERCETIAGFRSCHIGSFRPGRRVTDFILNSSGRVSRVSIGIVID